MSWSKLKNQAVYRFPAYTGWNPTRNPVFMPEDKLYDCRNIRVKDGIIRSRGGWSQFTTGETSGIPFSIFSYIDADGSTLVAAIGSTLKRYNTSSDGWETEMTLVAGTYANVEFANVPVSGGKTHIVWCDGDQLPMKWDVDNKPVELGSSLIADMTEGWVDNTSTGDGAIDAEESTTVLRGGTCLKLSASDAGVAKAIYNIGGLTQEFSAAQKQNPVCRIGDFGGTEIQYATRITTSGDSFDTVEFVYRPEGGPGSENIFVRLETDSDGTPSGTLIDSNAHGLLVGSHSADSRATGVISLQADVTYEGTVWVLFGICTDSTAPGDGVYTWDNQGEGERFELYYLKSPTIYGAYRTDATDPQDGTWTNYNRRPYVKLYDADQGSLSIGGAELTDEGDNEVWISVRSNDVSLVDDVDTTLVFTDSAGHTATESIDIQSDSDNTWVVKALPKDLFTESDAAFDWTDIVSVALNLNIEGDDSSGATINLYIDQIRFVQTETDEGASNGTNDRPPTGKYLAVSPSGDRLLLANTGQNTTNSGPNYIWYSDSYDIDSFTSTQYISFPQEITGIFTHGGLVHVFSRNQRWAMEPNYSASDWTGNASALDWKIALAHGPGTVSHRSVREAVIQGQSGILFLAEDGVWFASGLSAVRVSDDLDLLWEDMYSSDEDFYASSVDKDNWTSAAAGYFQGQYYLSLYGAGDSDNEVTLVFDTSTRGWIKDINSASVFPQCYTLWRNESGVPTLLASGDNGEVYEYVSSRTTVADDGTGYQSDFQTNFIGTELLAVVDWQTLNLWVRCPSTSARSLKVLVYTIEDYDDTASYDEWEEDPDTAILTVTKAWTPNTAFKWHRLRIQLDDNTNNVYPRSRAIAFKIYDDNDLPIDYRLESLICEPLMDELR